MECQYPGPFHLGISKEACENAGGNYFRTPCVTLKETIDNRPPKFNLDSPVDGDCQDSLQQLNVAYVSAQTGHANFPFESNKIGCNDFCRSLPGYTDQVAMMAESDPSSLSYASGARESDFVIESNLVLSETLTVKLPAKHGICVSAGASSASASSSYNSLTYAAINHQKDSSTPLQAWDDRDYKLYGLEKTPCNGGIFLRASLHKAFPLGTTTSVTASSQEPAQICVFSNV